jgi:NarL family two-component system response regulator LiaR
VQRPRGGGDGKKTSAAMRTLRIVLADDHKLVREAIRAAVALDGGIEVVGEAASGEQVSPLVLRTRPDVLILDLRMPGLDGFACLDAVRRRSPDVKVLVLSAVDDSESVADAFRRGATGYIFKSIDPADLASTIRQAASGTVFHAPPKAGRPAVEEHSLSRKELVVLKSVARGHSNKQIAKALWVSEQTVKYHLTNVYRKLDVANRTEAARFAYEHRLVEAPIHEGV